MHYCQRCDEPHPLLPEGEGARCPVCGSIDPTARRVPLFVVTGASGAGKSTLFPFLLDQLRGEAMGFDVDWLIDPFARHPSAAGRVDWPAFRDTWLHLAHGVAQNGLPTVLLGPFIPEHLEDLPGRRWVSDVHYLVLDCPDEVRRRRIEARPRWRSRDIAVQLEFAAWLRANLSPVIDTSTATPAETASAVAAWVRRS